MRDDLRRKLIASLLALDRSEIESLLPLLSGMVLFGQGRAPSFIIDDLMRRQRAETLEASLSDPKAIALFAELMRSIEAPAVVVPRKTAPPKTSVKAGPLARALLKED